MPSPAPAHSARVAMRRSFADGCGFAVMFGIGELYLPAFVLALSAGDIASGLVATVPPAMGALLQLLAPMAIRRLGSHKRWVVACSTVQAISFVPLIIAALVGRVPTWALFFAACLYFTSGMSGGAAWSTWISTFVPRRIQARWFGLRQRALQIGMLAGFATGGLILTAVTGGEPPERSANRSAVVLAFAGLFVIAAVARGYSAYMLARQPEPTPLPQGGARHGPLGFLRRAIAGDDGVGRGLRLLFYMFAARFAENIAAPYVNPYILSDLKGSYFQYTTLIGATMLGKIAVLGGLGWVAHRHGPNLVLVVAGVAITPLGWLWLISTDYSWLLVVQVLSGAAWGAYELSTWLLILRHIREEDRTGLMSFQFAGHWGSCVLGSLIGGWVLQSLGQSHEAYRWLFTLSSAVRLLTLIPLALVVLSSRREDARPAAPGELTGATLDPESQGTAGPVNE